MLCCAGEQKIGNIYVIERTHDELRTCFQWQVDPGKNLVELLLKRNPILLSIVDVNRQFTTFEFE